MADGQSSAIVVISRHGDAARCAIEDDLAAYARDAGQAVLLAPPLYHLADDDPAWARLAGLARQVAWFAWLHPRPLEALLRRHRAWGDGHRAFAIAEADPAGQWAAAGLPALPAAGAPPAETLPASPAGQRWYPVVDAERCTDCRHCLQFCLFGVYALDAAGGVEVVQPDRCKPGCPACSRVCPEGAIMFPLYAKDPAIAGAPGTLMKPDAAGRRLWYQRTGNPCPACGRADAEGDRGQGAPCGECGRRSAGPAPDDGLDDLIAELDRKGDGG